MMMMNLRMMLLMIILNCDDAHKMTSMKCALLSKPLPHTMHLRQR